MQNISSEARCIVCNNTNSTVFWRNPYRTIRRCNYCGLLFVFPQPNREKLHEQFQSNHFTRGSDQDQTRLDLEYDKWRHPSFELIAAKIRTLKPAGRLLDIGCAGGVFFDYFRDGNWELYGVEPSTLAFKIAQKRLSNSPRIHLFNTYLTDANIFSKKFDVVTVLEALYHMPNPGDELACIGAILKDDGIFLIDIPSYTYHRILRTGLLSYILTRSWCSLPSSHLFYYSKNNLLLLLKRNRFRIVEILPLQGSYYGSWFRRFSLKSYFRLSRLLFNLTMRRINIAQRVLYICRKF